MKKFISNSLFFLSLLLLCNTIVYIAANNMYHAEYDKVPDKDFHSFLFADSYGLPLGDHTEDYDVYNFSAASDSYFDIKRKINYLIREKYTIDKVYITVDDHTLSPYRERINNKDRSIIYSSNIDFSSYSEYIKERYIKHYAVLFSPTVRSVLRLYVMEKVEAILTNTGNPKAVIFDWESLTESERNKQAKSIKDYHFPPEGKSQTLQNTLEEIIVLGQEHGFEIIGLKYPLTDSYSRVISDLNFGADKLLASYQITVLDYSKMYIEEDKYFADPNHLNEIGGELFARYLLKN